MRSASDSKNHFSEISSFLVIQSDLFGMVKWPFQGVSDLQLGDEKGTLNHLVLGSFYSK